MFCTHTQPKMLTATTQRQWHLTVATAAASKARSTSLLTGALRARDGTLFCVTATRFPPASGAANRGKTHHIGEVGDAALSACGLGTFADSPTTTETRTAAASCRGRGSHDG